MTFYTWSVTASANNTADSTINLREGWAPSQVNNSVRALMAAAAKYRDDVSGQLNTGGSSTAYTITSNQVYTSLTDGIIIAARMHATNGTDPTLNVDSLGAKDIYGVSGTNVSSGDLQSGSIKIFTYDSGDDAWYVHGYTPGSTRGSLGLDTTDSPEFAGINLGHASDTTLTRTGSGDVAIEGNAVYRAGGTDVPVADGGTGSSNAAAARIALAALGAVSIQAFTTSGTWTKPANCQYILVIGTGGGAGGEDSNSTNVGAASGGAGATSIELIDVSAISSVSVTIGAGGGSGANGNDTTFGAHFTAGGGQASSGVNGGVGGTATGGSLNISGGGGGGGAADNGPSGMGGASFWGSGGAGQRVSGSGNDGLAYGSGGSGGFSTGSTAGGSGAGGVVFVLEFIT